MPKAYARKDRPDDFEGLFRRFKRAVEKSGILKVLKEYEHYTKPSEIKKRERAAAKKRWERRREEAMLPTTKGKRIKKVNPMEDRDDNY